MYICAYCGATDPHRHAADCHHRNRMNVIPKTGQTSLDTATWQNIIEAAQRAQAANTPLEDFFEEVGQITGS